MPHDRRFIEETFPVKEVSEHSAKEKNIRHGHISTLHIWWARRPLAASRATAYAALVPPPEDILDWQKQRDFIADLSKWENALNARLLEKARRAIYEAHAERLSRELGRPVTVEDIEAGRVPPPRVLDPFAGGGSYPLEALRLGCEAYANDYNPVAVLILKATLEYPQKYGRGARGAGREVRNENLTPHASSLTPLPLFPHNTASLTPTNPLLAAVKKWGNWVLEEARKELAAFYRSPDPDETIVGYIWARTLPCQNPSCGAEIPLMRQFWLAKKGTRDGGRGTRKKRWIALAPVVHPEKKHIAFVIVQHIGNTWQILEGQELLAQGYRFPHSSPLTPQPSHLTPPPSFDPKQGTVSRAVVTCPVCGAVMDAKTTRRLFQEGKAGQRMVAVVVTRDEGQGMRGEGRGARGDGRGRRRGKQYRLPTQEDLDAYAATERALAEKRERLAQAWGIDPVPTEPTPEGKGSGAERAFSVRNYGLDTWGNLFNARQQLALLTFAEKVRQAYEEMRGKGRGEEGMRNEGWGMSEDFARAVATYLGFAVSRLADYNSSLSVWAVAGEFIAHTFGRQALPMIWDYFELNPDSQATGDWNSALEWVVRVIEHLSLIPPPPTLTPHPSPLTPRVSHASATHLPYPDDHFDAVLTDPPYYDNVPYAYLSDFFYVWLKRAVGHLYPDLFATPLTPKGEEIVAYSHGQGGLEEGKQRFETMLGQAFREIHRVLKPGGLAVTVYAYKTTAGWETVINALLESGLVVSAAWPLNTEMQSRLRANESAALASSIYIVARKMERLGVGFYPEVRAELRRVMDARLQRLWEEGIGGADFFIAAIGAGIEVFGKYEKVMDYEGNLIHAGQLLDDVRELATDFAVRQILHNGFAGEVSDRTRFYVLWRWNYGEARVPFDEARKLAQSCGLDLTEEWRRKGSFVQKEKAFVRVLGPHQRDVDDLAQSGELIDVLHHVLLLWEKGQRQEMIRRLSESGYGTSEAFYRVAQAVSESLPLESKEKKLLDGLLTGRARLRQEVKQRRLL